MEDGADSQDAPKRGRPKKFIDLELVEKLAHIQCTYPEIASTLGVSVDTLTRHPDFAVSYKRGAEGGRKSLRRMQFESANRGNVAMQIWLGKQYLGQSDHVTQDIRKLPQVVDLSSEELRQFGAQLAARIAELRRQSGSVNGLIEAPSDVVDTNVIDADTIEDTDDQ
jgi:hypothetical protein